MRKNGISLPRNISCQKSDLFNYFYWTPSRVHKVGLKDTAGNVRAQWVRYSMLSGNALRHKLFGNTSQVGMSDIIGLPILSADIGIKM